MKIRLLGDLSVVQDNPHSIQNYFGWPSIAKLQDGRIAVVSSGFRLGHICPFGKAVISYSDDNGKTYTRPAPVIDTPLDDRDAGVTPFGDNGVVVTSFNNTVQLQRKWSRGNTFVNGYLDQVTPEQQAKYLGSEFCFSFDGGRTFGEIHLSPVTSPHGMTALSDGTLLWVGAKQDEAELRAYRVETDGTMEQLGEIPQDGCGLFCEPHTVELTDGTLICHIRVQGSDLYTTYQSESHDGGRTWTPAHRVLSDHGGAPAHLMLHSSGLLLSVYGYREPPYGIRLIASRDGGATWSEPQTLYDNEDISVDLGYPASVELNDGTILTVFYAHPKPDMPAVILQQHWAIEP